MGADWKEEMEDILNDSEEKSIEERMEEEGIIPENSIVVIDNGTQYGLLYVKRLKDLGIRIFSIDAGVYKDNQGNLVRKRINLEDIARFAGVVVAGGRGSVTDDENKRVDIDPKIYSDFENPVLGTCFGHQDMADRLGGTVVNDLKQCGPVYTKVDLTNPLFDSLDYHIQRVNATHNDGVKELPPGFKTIAYSKHAWEGFNHIDAMYKEPDEGKNNWRFGTQFHPETFLTKNGNTMLQNFARLCGLEPKEIKEEVPSTPNIDEVVEEQFEKIRATVDKPIFLPISGGIDSTVATKMLLEAGIDKKQIKAFHINTGYNRYGESEEVVDNYHDLGWDFVELLHRKRFFANFSLSEEELEESFKGKGFGGIKLKDAVYSEHKRLLFQVAYDKVITEYQKSFGFDEKNSILVQGTNQADKVESGRGGKKHSGSAHIKRHHNVGEFVDKYKKEGNLLEPLSQIYKSDIYELGKRFGLPAFFSTRKPFPGPGLLIRIGNHNMIESGMYTQEDIDELSSIANTYSKERGVDTYVTTLEAVGSSGDERAEGVISVLQLKDNHESNLENNIKKLMDVAGQLPHYTTVTNNKCITRFITPLFAFDLDKKPTYTEAKNEGKTVEYLQIFDHEVNKIIDDIGFKMTQTVNYVISDNLGEEGKYTFVFRPWEAPELLSGMAKIPEGEMRQELFDRLRGLKDKYDFIGNICIDWTYKPIGTTEIN